MRHQPLIAGLLVAVVAATACLTTLVRGADAPAAATVQVTGVRVAAAVKDRDLSGFGWEEGTSLRLQFSVPQGTIVDFDRDASSVASMKDDKGGTLVAGGAGTRSMDSGFGMMPDFTSDRKACAVEVKAPKAPTKGTTTITLKGEAVLSVASVSKDVAVDKVELKVGTKLTLGDVPLEITKVGKSDWGDGMTVTFKTDRVLTSIAELNFVGADGAKLDAREGSSSTMKMLGKLTVEKEFNFKTLPATAKVVAKVWTDMKTVKVPIDVTAGLGM